MNEDDVVMKFQSAVLNYYFENIIFESRKIKYKIVNSMLYLLNIFDEDLEFLPVYFFRGKVPLFAAK